MQGAINAPAARCRLELWCRCSLGLSGPANLGDTPAPSRCKQIAAKGP